MSAFLIGTRTLGGCLPSTLEALGALDSAVAVSLPKVQAELAGAVELQAELSLSPPTLSGSLSLAGEIVAAVQGAITLGLPDASFDMSAITSLLATLQLELASLQAHVAFSASLGATLGSSGVHLYGYAGQSNALGSAFNSELSNGFPGGQPTDQAYAFLLGTTSPQTRFALETVFGNSLTLD